MIGHGLKRLSWILYLKGNLGVYFYSAGHCRDSIQSGSLCASCNAAAQTAAAVCVYGKDKIHSAQVRLTCRKCANVAISSKY